MSEPGAGPVVLTGATGFLGGHLMTALVARGRRVVVLGRPLDGCGLEARISSLLDWFGLDRRDGLVETAEVDLLAPSCGLDERRAASLVSRAGPFVHCASDTRFSESRRREIVDANLGGLRGILDLAARGRAPVFHYVSTAYAAGKSPGLCREELAAPAGFTNVYEETKAAAEREVAARCDRLGLPYTILRPSIVYGDSKTGRTTRFNALYYHVKSLAYLRDIVLQDLRRNGGRRASAWGAVLTGDGRLRLPLRFRMPRRGRVNLVPIDYFVAAVLAVLDRPDAGGVYHLTSPNPKPIDELAGYCESYLGLEGIRIVEGPPNGEPLNPPEELLRKLLEPYLPYLADDRIFDRTRAERAMPGLAPPALTREVFDRCMDYAVSVGWGNGRGRPSD